MSPRTREQMGDDIDEIQPYIWIESIIYGILLCAAIAYIIYGTIFLVNDRAKCGGYSKFWIFCLAQLFSSIFSYLISLGIYVKDESSPDGVGRMNYLSLTMYILFDVPFLVWGILSLYVFDVRCNAEHNSHQTSNLYIWATVAFWVRTIYFILVMIGTVIASLRSPVKKEFDESV
jgi:hypothetical protein